MYCSRFAQETYIHQNYLSENLWNSVNVVSLHCIRLYVSGVNNYDRTELKIFIWISWFILPSVDSVV